MPRRRLILLILLAAAICPYFVDLGGSAIWDANEAFYVETPREMIERGDYVSPTFNYEPRFNKPVLSYWIVAAFYALFGISVGVQRLPIALGAVVLIVTAFFLCRAAEPETDGRPASDAPLWAGLGLAVAPRLMMFARRIFIDIFISMFMALSLLFFALSERFPERRRLWLALMYVSVGLGVLTKGPVAALLPGLVFAVYLGVHRELRRAAGMLVPLGIVIVLAIVVPWYAVLYHRYGWTYITSFFVGENIDRYTTGLGVQVDRGLLFYAPVILTDSFPLSLYLVPAAILWFVERRRGRQAHTSHRVRTLLWLWILVIVGFFSISAAKQDLYIFPIVPAVAALAGIAIAKALDAGQDRSPVGVAVRWTSLAVGVSFVVTGVGLVFLFRTAGAAYALAGIPAIAAVGIAGGLATVFFAARAALASSLIALLVATIAVNWIFVLRTLPSFEAYKPVPAFAELLLARAGADDVIATHDVAMPSLVFYLRRHVEEVFDVPHLVELLGSERTVYAVLSTDAYDALRREMGVQPCVIDHRPTFDVKLRNVLERQPLPELLIVTNRCN